MILTHRTSFPSAKNLRQALLEETGVRYLVTKYPDRIRRLHIRYGASAPVNCLDTEFNSPEFINLVSNKVRFSNAIKDKFNTPVFIRNRPPSDYEFPIVIRQYISSFGGKGIIMCPDRETFDQNWNGEYWTRFVRTTQEFRVHSLGGEIGRLFRKVRIRINGVRPPEDEFPVRTCRSGDYRFSLWNDTERLPELNDVVRRLYKANSAPGINLNTAKVYVNYLIQEGVV